LTGPTFRIFETSRSLQPARQVKAVVRPTKGARMDEFVIEPSESRDTGPCECCGNNSRRVWGFVRTPKAPLACYFVEWTLNRVHDHGANFDLILGRWGEEATAQDRVLAAFAYRLLESGPGFVVINAGDRPAASSELVGRALARLEVVGRPIAQEAFAIVDAVLAKDPGLVNCSGPTPANQALHQTGHANEGLPRSPPRPREPAAEL
jgi:hypothetical protein